MSAPRWVDVPGGALLAPGGQPLAVRARASTSLVGEVQGRLVGGREVAAFRGQIALEQRGPWGWQAVSAAEPELVDAALAALRAAGELA